MAGARRACMHGPWRHLPAQGAAAGPPTGGRDGQEGGSGRETGRGMAGPPPRASVDTRDGLIGVPHSGAAGGVRHALLDGMAGPRRLPGGTGLLRGARRPGRPAGTPGADLLAAWCRFPGTEEEKGGGGGGGDVRRAWSLLDSIAAVPYNGTATVQASAVAAGAEGGSATVELSSIPCAGRLPPGHPFVEGAPSSCRRSPARGSSAGPGVR